MVEDANEMINDYTRKITDGINQYMEMFAILLLQNGHKPEDITRYSDVSENTVGYMTTEGKKIMFVCLEYVLNQGQMFLDTKLWYDPEYFPIVKPEIEWYNPTII